MAKQKCNVCKTLNALKEFIKHPSVAAWSSVDTQLKHFSERPFCEVHLIVENGLAAADEVEKLLEEAHKMAFASLKTGTRIKAGNINAKS